MPDWMTYEIVRAYREYRLREAERQHLVNELVTVQAISRPVYGPALARIGGWLVMVGTNLQAHYGNITPAEPPEYVPTT